VRGRLVHDKVEVGNTGVEKSKLDLNVGPIRRLTRAIILA
jgi:hypothetical protein